MDGPPGKHTLAIYTASLVIRSVYDFIDYDFTVPQLYQLHLHKTVPFDVRNMTASVVNNFIHVTSSRFPEVEDPR